MFSIKVAAFPLKIVGASVGPARVVAKPENSRIVYQQSLL
ncbi:MAG: hypothetical protein AVDCRST_MAG56-1469 [uncultured Cytophagales bacterium]|uniref:Uncharacterized protein n=1 Tax=uncultured Cytophagales bacterium TaxID=158755 RepID=A0A6J4I6U8_9SPHI|nr:MAG: hypothetical protein AVDCRST_MAG56-1469 [uncultured Cytophagales bacterium]